MLNELHQVVTALQARGATIEEQHPSLTPMGKNDPLLVVEQILSTPLRSFIRVYPWFSRGSAVVLAISFRICKLTPRKPAITNPKLQAPRRSVPFHCPTLSVSAV